MFIKFIIVNHIRMIRNPQKDIIFAMSKHAQKFVTFIHNTGTLHWGLKCSNVSECNYKFQFVLVLYLNLRILIHKKGMHSNSIRKQRHNAQFEFWFPSYFVRINALSSFLLVAQQKCEVIRYWKGLDQFSILFVATPQCSYM